MYGACIAESNAKEKCSHACDGGGGDEMTDFVYDDVMTKRTMFYSHQIHAKRIWTTMYRVHLELDGFEQEMPRVDVEILVCCCDNLETMTASMHSTW